MPTAKTQTVFEKLDALVEESARIVAERDQHRQLITKLDNKITSTNAAILRNGLDPAQAAEAIIVLTDEKAALEAKLAAVPAALAAIEDDRKRLREECHDELVAYVEALDADAEAAIDALAVACRVAVAKRERCFAARRQEFRDLDLAVPPRLALDWVKGGEAGKWSVWRRAIELQHALETAGNNIPPLGRDDLNAAHPDRPPVHIPDPIGNLDRARLQAAAGRRRA